MIVKVDAAARLSAQQELAVLNRMSMCMYDPAETPMQWRSRYDRQLAQCELARSKLVTARQGPAFNCFSNENASAARASNDSVPFRGWRADSQGGTHGGHTAVHQRQGYRQPQARDKQARAAAQPPSPNQIRPIDLLPSRPAGSAQLR